MDRARYAIDAVVIEGRSLRAVAASIDMSKSWVAKQVARYRAGGYEALVRHSTAPHRRPTQISPALEEEIVVLRKQLDEEGFGRPADDPVPPRATPWDRAWALHDSPGPSASGVRHPPAPQTPPDLLAALRGQPAQ